MKLFQVFNYKKIILLNIFLTLYVIINLIGGERGLISYFEKKNIEKELKKKEFHLSKSLESLENKNILLSEKMNLDSIPSYEDKKYSMKRTSSH